MTHRLTNNYAKNYCNRTLIVKVIVENVVTCFLGHGVDRSDVRYSRRSVLGAGGLRLSQPPPFPPPQPTQVLMMIFLSFYYFFLPEHQNLRIH